MNILLILLVVVAIALFIVGGFVEAVQFLIWVAVALLVIAVIAWALRMITGRRQP